MAIEIRKPTAITDNVGYTNPGNAYDLPTGNDTTTFANRTALVTASPSIIFHTFLAAGQTYTALTVNVNYTVTGLSDDTLAIEYSIDGGTNWLPLRAASSTNQATIVPLNIALSPSQNLTLVQVDFDFAKVGSPDRPVIRIYDVWLEGTYTPAAVQQFMPVSFAYG